MQLNSFRLFVPAGGKQRDLDKGLQEHHSGGEEALSGEPLSSEKMKHLGVASVRLTDAAFSSP